jgi:hypothetical protein
MTGTKKKKKKKKTRSGPITFRGITKSYPPSRENGSCSLAREQLTGKVQVVADLRESFLNREE